MDMASPSPFEDYQVGKVLTLSVIPEHGEQSSASTIQARIRHLQNPRTLSCCMIVDLLGEGYLDNPVFLKLYDRRFSDHLREDQGIDPWTRDTEKEYINTVRTGAARQFLHDLHTIPNFEDTGETWDDGQTETFMTEKVHKLFNTETTVYKALRDIQGTVVPRIVAYVRLALSLPDGGIGPTDAMELIHIKGILLQYIDGFPLSQVQNHAPRFEWQSIVDQAIAVVGVIGDHGVIHKDVRPDNFMVQRDRSGRYSVLMIDLGLARLRRLGESNRDWARAKLSRGEERAIGLVMRMRLKREGFELQFEQSNKYREWIDSDDDLSSVWSGQE